MVKFLLFNPEETIKVLEFDFEKFFSRIWLILLLKAEVLDKSKFTNCCSDNESKDLQARVSRTINDIFETESKVKKTHKSSIANNTFKIL